VSDRVAIEARRQAWIDVTTAGDSAACTRLLTEDVVWVPPGMAALSGRKAVCDWMVPFFELYEYDFSVHGPRLQLAGDWAVDRGTFTSALISRHDGRRSSHSGEYLIVWRREPDREWYIERYVHLADIQTDFQAETPLAK